MHIKYKNPLFWSRWEKKHHSSALQFSRWNPKVCWIHLFPFMCCLYFLFWDTFMAQAFTEPSTFFPFVESKEANPINFIISSSSSLLLLTQLSHVLCSLFSLSSSSLLSFSHLFFLSVDKGKEMWICVVLGTWNAFCAGSESGFLSDLSPWTGTFLGACVLFPGTWTRPPTLPETHLEYSSRTEKYLFRSST